MKSNRRLPPPNVFLCRFSRSLDPATLFYLGRPLLSSIVRPFQRLSLDPLHRQLLAVGSAALPGTRRFRDLRVGPQRRRLRQRLRAAKGAKRNETKFLLACTVQSKCVGASLADGSFGRDLSSLVHQGTPFVAALPFSIQLCGCVLSLSRSSASRS